MVNPLNAPESGFEDQKRQGQTDNADPLATEMASMQGKDGKILIAQAFNDQATGARGAEKSGLTEGEQKAHDAIADALHGKHPEVGMESQIQNALKGKSPEEVKHIIDQLHKEGIGGLDYEEKDGKVTKAVCGKLWPISPGHEVWPGGG